MGTLTDDGVALLKREMNFLMWTNDPPCLDDKIAMFQSSDPHVVMERSAVNMQCLSHAYVTAGLMKEAALHLWEGHAFISDPAKGSLHQVPKHYWISFNEQGFADFSLHAPLGAPAVVGSRCIPMDWSLEVTQDRDELNTLVSDAAPKCIYFPLKKTPISLNHLSAWMDCPFDGAFKMKIILPLGKILGHCNRLLQGAAQTLTMKTQKEAWQVLAT